MRTAVLVMAYGGPESLEEIPGYLADIRAGRPTPRRVLDEITENYRAIGGRSPLLEVTRRQVDALQEELGEAFRCYLGMRHWSPWIEEVVGQMIEDDVTRAIGIVLAPQFSALSVAKYQQRVADGLELYRGTIAFQHVSSYHDAPGLIDAFAGRVVEGLSRWSDDDRDDVHVVFTAHSLPERLLANGDPYGVQCLETARLVAERSELQAERWSWSYQSAGRTPEPWAGPDLREHLTELAARGIRDVVVVPVGFVSDHVEILFDIDVKARARADELGDAARAAARPERRPGVHRHARGARAGPGGVKVVVVGGGIAGLAAAHKLEALLPEAEVTLVERSQRVGGALFTERVDGFVIEAGPDSFLSRKERGVGLCEELGIADELVGRRARERAELRPPRIGAPPTPRGTDRDDPERSRLAGREHAPLAPRAGSAWQPRSTSLPRRPGLTNRSRRSSRDDSDRRHTSGSSSP